MTALGTGHPAAVDGIAASVVVYRNPPDEVRAVVECLLSDGVGRVFIVDNAPENSPFKMLADVFPQVTYLPSPGNVGYGAGHNQALRHSIGAFKYHLICNPDIAFPPGVLAALRDELDRRPEVGLCMPRIVDADGAVQYLCKRLPRPFDLFARRFLPRSWLAKRMLRYEMRDQSYDAEMSPPSLSGCFMFFRVQVLASLGGFDERFFMYMEDLDLSRRAAAVAVNLYFPAVAVRHAHAAGSYHDGRLLRAHLVSAIRYFNKWGWWPIA